MTMRVAALYDIHSNLPALEAVLAELRQVDVDRVVVGGDVFTGPMPLDTMARLEALDMPTDFLMGNGDREMLNEHPSERIPEMARLQLRWCREQLDAAQRAAVAAWPPTVRLELPGLGSVLFCHATPRNDEEIVTQLVPEEMLHHIYDGVADVVVCGHTHIHYDRMVGPTRVVNAGSVGMPFEAPGAYWLLLDGSDIQQRRTAYGLEAAAGAARRTEFPDAEQFASVYILQPPDMLQMFTKYALDALKPAAHGA